MPLIRIKQLERGGMLGLWQMTEHPSCDMLLYRQAQQRHHHEARQREYVCVRLLLRSMLESGDVEIGHTAEGKPYLIGDSRSISISHTRGYCVVLVAHQPCGVDIEYVSNRVDRIAHRFMRDDEEAHHTLMRLVVWSAKEALYKLCSEDRLTFEQMRICFTTPLSEEVGSAMVVKGENLVRQVAFQIGCLVEEAFVLTWVTSPSPSS